MKTVIDAYCGRGGASMGYHLAGFRVVGVDIDPQPDYPFEFIQGDAIEYLLAHGHEYDLRHASPPCQASTALTKGTNAGREYPQLIPATRDALDAVGGPYVIENVQGSALRRDLTLCGEMFGLDVIRHRYFELSGVRVRRPAHVPHRGRVSGWRHGVFYPGPYVAVYGDGGGKGSVSDWQRAMGISWTSDKKGLAEAIPPAYTRYIGEEIQKNLFTNRR